MSKRFLKVRQLIRHSKSLKMETGFSMLEAVVVVGVLLALAVTGFFSYGSITENTKKAKVRSAASEIHTGVLVASMDNDPNTKPKDVIDNWNGSTDQIFVEILKPAAGETSANGDFCVQATNKQDPLISAQTGSCEDAPAGSTDTDGDGIPDSIDTTPNGGSEPATPTAKNCLNLSVTEEIVCWMDVANVEQTKYQTANGVYFGDGYGQDPVDRPYTGAAFEGIPLLHAFQQEHYADTSDPAWNYVEVEVTMAARDGAIWDMNLYKEYNQVDGFYFTPASPTGQNVNYICKHVTPQQLLPDCGRLGLNINMYSDKKADNDATADADIRKILEAQLSYIKINKMPYGGYDKTVDMKAYAGTTYDAKVYSVKSGAYAHWVRAMVVAPNGDLYTADATINNTATSINYDVAATFRYSTEFVSTVCGRPYIGETYQSQDMRTCSSLGYSNFKP